MSPSSTGDSPQAAAAIAVRPFLMQSRDSFHIEVPSPSLTAVTNGTHSLKSPSALKAQRTPSFGRDGFMGAAQKARNMSQSSDHRLETVGNGMAKTPSDEGSNPLKRRNTDVGGVDYPRRRATIAVRFATSHQGDSRSRAGNWSVPLLTDVCASVRSADRGSRDAMARSRSASSAQSSAQNASTESLASSWMPATSSSWSA